MEYSAVIATRDRAAYLAATLRDLASQTRLPQLVVVVDASVDGSGRSVCETQREAGLPVCWLRADHASAARQRNQGAREVDSPLIAFVDDDVGLPPDLFARLLSVFENDVSGSVGGVAGRIRGLEHRRPRGLLWWYYRIQAGYAHPHYGARLFGPAINCLPCYAAEVSEWIRADWLNSTCVVYRNDSFRRERFPEFEGYSFMEDVHLSSRIGRSQQLFFHASAIYEHYSPESDAKRDKYLLARMRFQNQFRVATEVMGLSPRQARLKLALHRLFCTVNLLRRRPPGWREELAGTWN